MMDIYIYIYRLYFAIGWLGQGEEDYGMRVLCNAIQ